MLNILQNVDSSVLFKIMIMWFDDTDIYERGSIMGKTLTPKQERFCHLYIQYGDMARAYKEAYDSARMSQATIRRKAVEVMQVPKVSAMIRQLREELSESMKIDAERTLQELARIAFSDFRQVFDKGGQLLSPDQWPETVAPAIQFCKTRQDSSGDIITEIKFWPKVAALEALSKHLGLFERDNRQKAERDVSVTLDPALAEMINAVKEGIEQDAERRTAS